MAMGDKGATLDGLKASHDNLDGKITDLKSDLGSLTDLDTDDKRNLVAAINEVASNSGGSGGGLSATAKAALLACFQNVAWINDGGQTYYNALSNALNSSSDQDDEIVDGYTFYDYFQYSETVTSVGQTRAFKTKVYSNIFDYKIKLKTKILSSITRNISCVGSRNGSSNDEYYAVHYNKTNEAFNVTFRGGTSDGVSAALDTVHTVIVSNTTSSPSTLYVDGNSVNFTWTYDSSYSNGFYALTSGYSGIPLFGDCQFGILEVYDSSNNLVNKYRPAVRTMDNQIGIYDTIENIFYTCSTTSYATIGHADCKYSVGNWS